MKTIEDYWIYLFRSHGLVDHIPPHAPEEIVEAFDTVAELNWTAEEKEAYEHHVRMSIMDEKTAMNTEREKGKAEGRSEEKIEIAKQMLAEDCDIHFIARMTNLPYDILEKLKAGK